MKIYIAGVFHNQIRFNGYKKDLEILGHQVISRWLLGPHEIPIDATEEEKERFLCQFGYEDLEDVMKCNCLIQFTDSYYDELPVLVTPYTRGWWRGGRHVELGVGLARKFTEIFLPESDQIKIIMVGKREQNIFHHLPEEFYQWYDSWEDLLCILKLERDLSSDQNRYRTA